MNDISRKNQLTCPVTAIAGKSLEHLLPPKIGLPSLDAYLHGWKKHSEYIVGGRAWNCAADMTLTLAQHFVKFSGQLIWIGTYNSCKHVCERMIFCQAGIPLSLYGSMPVDENQRPVVDEAYKNCCAMSIDFLDIDQCGNSKIEKEFISDVRSDRPTLVIVDASNFSAIEHDRCAASTRRAILDYMISQIKESNGDWRILWHLPVKTNVATDWECVPLLGDLDDDELVSRAEAVLFTQLNDESLERTPSQLIVAKNRSGTTGVISLQHLPTFSLWMECY